MFKTDILMMIDSVKTIAHRQLTGISNTNGIGHNPNTDRDTLLRILEDLEACLTHNDKQGAHHALSLIELAIAVDPVYTTPEGGTMKFVLDSQLRLWKHWANAWAMEKTTN